MTSENEIADAIENAGETIANCNTADMGEMAENTKAIATELHYGLQQTGDAIRHAMESLSEYDSEGNSPANVVDGLYAIANSIHALSRSVQNHTDQENHPQHRL